MRCSSELRQQQKHESAHSASRLLPKQHHLLTRTQKVPRPGIEPGTFRFSVGRPTNCAIAALGSGPSFWGASDATPNGGAPTEPTKTKQQVTASTGMTKHNAIAPPHPPLRGVLLGGVRSGLLPFGRSKAPFWKVPQQPPVDPGAEQKLAAAAALCCFPALARARAMPVCIAVVCDARRMRNNSTASLRAEPNGFRVHLLSRSDALSMQLETTLAI